MRDREKERREGTIEGAEGSLSVFFSMLFPVLILMLLSLLTFGRARLLRTAVTEDISLAGKSVLAGYSSDFVRKYGLYMVPASRLGSELSFFLSHNTYHPYGSYEIGSLDIQVEETLEDPEVLERQIVHFMEERFVISSAAEILAMFSQLEEQEEVRKEYRRYRHSLELYLIQTDYARLITDVYGIREDGGRNDHAVLTFLKNELKLPSVTEAAETCTRISDAGEDVDAAGELERAVSVLERAKGEIEAILWLLEEASDLADSVKDQLETLLETEREEREENGAEEETSLTGELGVTPEQLAKCGRVCRKDALILEDALDCITLLLAGEAPGSLAPVYALAAYDYQIILPHEARPAGRGIDLSVFLRTIGGYSVDVETLAPDRDIEGVLSILAREGEGQENEAFSPLDLTLTLDMTEIMEHILTEEYGLGMFQNFRQAILAQEGEPPENLRGDPISGRALTNEAEFLVVGRANEFSNVDGTKNRIVALRTLLNMASLLADPEKRQSIEELSAATGGILLPGLGNALAFGIILTGWSTVEAVEDYRSLTRGGRIPLFKDADDFRTSLEGLLSGDSPGDDLDTAEPGDGMSYRQYLRILVLMVPQETLLGRIQILLRVNEPWIKLEEAVTGFRVSGTALPASGLPSSLDFAAGCGYE